jgi:predicted MFS family arabinose efflux permease
LKTSISDSSTGPRGGVGAWTIVILLSLAYALSFVDRQILSLLVQPIRLELSITDVQFSLLQGFAFALTYSVVGVPLGSMADRFGPRIIITAGIAIWSVATAACTLATDFGSLFVARVIVGAGEAALVPASYGLMVTLFQPRTFARAMAVFMSGSTIGAGLAVFIGGFALAAAVHLGPLHVPLVGSYAPWRVTFLIVGLPGLVLALVVGFTLKSQDSATQLAIVTARRTRSGLHALWQDRRILIPMYVGFSLFTLAAYGIIAWLPEAFRRTYHWLPQDYAVVAGPLQIGASVTGSVAAGILMDRLHARTQRDVALLFAFTAIVALVPLILIATSVRSPGLAFGFLTGVWMLMGSLLPASGVAIQMAVSRSALALGTAVFMLCANLIGMGCGPTAVALATKYYFGSDTALISAIGLVGSTSLIGSAFLLGLARRRL